MDVGKNTSGRDGDAAEQLVQLLVVLHGKGDVTGHNASLLVVAGGITGKLQDLGAEVLEDGCEVDGGAGAHAGGVLSLAEEAADTTDGELKPGLGRRAGRLLLAAASFSFSRHGGLSWFGLMNVDVQKLQMTFYEIWSTSVVVARLFSIIFSFNYST